MNNLFISYDLNSPGQDYTKTHEAIKSLGDWAKVQKSLWYLKSQYSELQVKNTLWAAMDRNDSLIVVNATTNCAAWEGLAHPDVSQFIIDEWSK
ncbi:hypothetical protein [Marinomonas aquiplantarum]|uniref:CRISPR-associated protein Cas2 n=1 Tax=Marinomonas aquiplantarum TaxID=491951 RepID=A0A366D013_9GAMM|nr:hypothetical protein [Marinomonas aquiplantarum]RBO83420.1 hypothetical protein DFP76_104239 [Marinomonas aquiplantarum]